MAWLNPGKRSWTYTDDFGNDWRRGAQATIVSQLTDGDVTVGGAAAATSVPSFSKAKLRPRGVYCTSPGRPTKIVTVYAPDAPLITPGTTINLNTGVDSYEYTSTSDTLPERKIRSWAIKEQS